MRPNVHGSPGCWAQRVRTCISRCRGKGNQRRAANYSATPAITIYSPRHVNSFLGPGYSSAIAGHAASRNTFLERLFIAPDFSDDAEFGEPENAGSPNQRRFRFPVPRGYAGHAAESLLFQARSPTRPAFINKDIDMVGVDLSGGDAKNRRKGIVLHECEKRIKKGKGYTFCLFNQIWITFLFLVLNIAAITQFMIQLKQNETINRMSIRNHR